MEPLDQHEEEIMGVFRRITGFFSKTPKANSSRDFGGIWMSLQRAGTAMSMDDVAPALKGAEAKGMLRLDEDKGVAYLTDEGHEYICR